MREDLLGYLDAIDERLVHCLDAEGNLSSATAARLYRYALAMLQGHISPAHVTEDWGDFFPLAEVFVRAYGTERLRALHRAAGLISSRSAGAGRQGAVGDGAGTPGVVSGGAGRQGAVGCGAGPPGAVGCGVGPLAALGDADSSLLVDLVRELGSFVYAQVRRGSGEEAAG